METETQQQENSAESESISQEFITTSATSTGISEQELSHPTEEEPTETSADVAAPTPAAAEDNNEGEEVEAPTVPAKKNGGKAKSTTRRRSGRAASRRWVKGEMREARNPGTIANLGHDVSVWNELLHGPRNDQPQPPSTLESIELKAHPQIGSLLAVN